MPLYEYECRNCSVIEEFIRKPEKRREPGICPHCQSPMTYVDRIHRSNFSLKGQGWYRDGYSGKSNVVNINDAKKPAK